MNLSLGRVLPNVGCTKVRVWFLYQKQEPTNIIALGLSWICGLAHPGLVWTPTSANRFGTGLPRQLVGCSLRAEWGSSLSQVDGDGWWWWWLMIAVSSNVSTPSSSKFHMPTEKEEILQEFLAAFVWPKRPSPTQPSRSSSPTWISMPVQWKPKGNRTWLAIHGWSWMAPTGP